MLHLEDETDILLKSAEVFGSTKGLIPAPLKEIKGKTYSTIAAGYEIRDAISVNLINY